MMVDRKRDGYDNECVMSQDQIDGIYINVNLRTSNKEIEREREILVGFIYSSYLPLD